MIYKKLPTVAELEKILIKLLKDREDNKTAGIYTNKEGAIKYAKSVMIHSDHDEEDIKMELKVMEDGLPNGLYRLDEEGIRLVSNFKIKDKANETK